MTGSARDIFARPGPRLYTIDAGRPFLKDLASGLLIAAGDDPEALADFEIRVPTRRAARGLVDAFLAARGDRGAVLLPRIAALGDADEDADLLDAAAAEDAVLPSSIAPVERRLALARLVAAAEKQSFDGQENWPAALAAAEALGALLDSLYTEEVDPERLKSLAPEEHAAHWSRSLDFLNIVIEAWPRYLESAGVRDAAARRALLLDRETEKLLAERPDRPIVIAGTTGSAPAVTRLLRAAASLPRGAVVLPGVDLALARDARAWAAIEDPHPQAGLKALIEAFGAAPGDVAPWPGSAPESRQASPPRAALLSLALRPAEATDDWLARIAEAQAADPGLEAATAGLHLIEAADEEAEAAAVALLFRETLEAPDRTAMLVTPDRGLSRRVAAQMRRWGVEVDDSAGVPFANSPCGTYLRLVAEVLSAPEETAALLALARHPLAGFGLSRGALESAVDRIDRAARGVRRLSAQEFEALPALAQARDAWPKAAVAPFEQLLRAHLSAAEQLAARDTISGAERVWRGEDGEAGVRLLSEAMLAAPTLGDITRSAYPRVFAQMLAGASVRRRAPGHPRLAILGPLEARLQSADLVILGGLNEGVWPGDPGADPFLSRQMRKDLGLASPERRIGLAAHDFAQGAAAPKVALTRARRAGGAPTRPSRWIVRLKNILEGARATGRVDRSAQFADWARALDEAGPARPVAPPRPTPPFAARPRALSVTQMETWLRDPYAIYARHVLKLRKLDAIDEPFGARHLGQLLHKVFETAARAGERPGREGLAAIFDAHAAAFGLGAEERVFLAPDIARALDWFAAFDAERRAHGAPFIIEGDGAIDLALTTAPFRLTARADRIDLLADDSTYLIDYKTRPPSRAQAKIFDVQLPLTAMMIAEGGFVALGPATVAGYRYVRALKRKGDASDDVGEDGAAAIAAARAAGASARVWIETFDDPQTPYLSQPRPQFLSVYGDYDHLARRRERSAEGDDE